jgi:hypothetical protein
VHTAIVLVIGLVVLGACLFVGHAVGGAAAMSRAALFFLPLWFIGAGVNMYIGVRSAGYAISEETPVFLAVFAIPALVALLTWWKLSRP